jgi:hypothetical protein
MRNEKEWRPFLRKGAPVESYTIELAKLEERLMNAIEKLTAAVDRAIDKNIRLSAELVDAKAECSELKAAMDSNAERLDGALGVPSAGHIDG